MAGLLISLRRPFRRCCGRFHQHLLQWTRPSDHSLLGGTLTDLARTKSALLAEHALLRQQLIMLRRQVKRPACTSADRLLRLILARAVRCWKQALLIVQPDTLLGWHRQAFHWFWRRRSKPTAKKPTIPADTVALIQAMALSNRLWGGFRASAENCSRWASGFPNAPSKSIYARNAHALLLKRDPPSCTIMPRRFGRATSCQSPTSSFARSLPAWCAGQGSSSCGHRFMPREPTRAVNVSWEAYNVSVSIIC
jgi:hypothetical protein